MGQVSSKSLEPSTSRVTSVHPRPAAAPCRIVRPAERPIPSVNGRQGPGEPDPRHTSTDSEAAEVTVWAYLRHRSPQTPRACRARGYSLSIKSRRKASESP